MPVILIAYALVNAVAWWLASPQEFGDTYRYFGSTLLDIQNPGITPVLVYTTLQDPRLITALQVALQAVSFALLALEVRRSIPARALGMTVSVLVLVLSLTQPLWSWSQLLGSESLTLSAAVLWMAAVLWVRRARSLASVIGAVAATAFLVVTRPMMAGVALAVSVVLAVLLWGRARGSAIALVGSTLAFAAYGAMRLSMLSSDPTFRVRYAIGNFIDKAPSFREYAIDRMPPCEPLVAAVNGPAPWDDGWKFQGTLAGTCPETFLWMRSDATASQAWVPAMPREAWANFAGIARDLGYVGYTPWSGIPAVGELPGQALPAWLLTVGALLIGLVLTLAFRAHMRWNGAAVLAALVASAAIIVTAFTVWSADGIEHSRHLQPIVSLMPLAALLVVPIGFTAARAAPGRRARATAGSARAG